MAKEKYGLAGGNSMEKLIDKIIGAHKLMVEVDSQVRTCGIASTPRWHIYVTDDFVRVVLALGYQISDVRVDGNHRILWHRGVEIFTLVEDGEVLNIDITAAN